MTRLLEHHGLDLLAEAGVTVPLYRAVASAEAAADAARALGGAVVVKALLPAGGRRRAGGVVPAGTPERAAAAARTLVCRTLGPFAVTQVLVQAWIDIREEYFCAFTLDSMTRTPVVLFSALGGVEVEDLLRDQPGVLVTRPVDPGPDLPLFLAREIAEEGGLTRQRLLDVALTLCRLY